MTHNPTAYRIADELIARRPEVVRRFLADSIVGAAWLRHTPRWTTDDTEGTTQGLLDHLGSTVTDDTTRRAILTEAGLDDLLDDAS